MSSIIFKKGIIYDTPITIPINSTTILIRTTINEITFIYITIITIPINSTSIIIGISVSNSKIIYSYIIIQYIKYRSFISIDSMPITIYNNIRIVNISHIVNCHVLRNINYIGSIFKTAHN